MNIVRRRYEALQTRIDALSLRERAIIFVALTAFLYLIWNTLLMNPLSAEQRTMLSQINSTRTEVAALEEQLKVVMHQHEIDPNKPEREHLAKLDRQLAQANENISKMITGLIAPEEMAKILEQVLNKQKGLTFVRLENLGSKALVDVQSESAAPEATGIFKHSFRIELQGSFNQTLAYLRALETLPWQFRWDEVKITMQDYPTADVVITVHTLSLQEGWIGV
jgi:MSHA biogenesis protein MshJ